MARIRWERNEKGELVPVDPKKYKFSDGAINNHINMRTTWSGTTKLELSQTTIGEDIKSRGGEI